MYVLKYAPNRHSYEGRTVKLAEMNIMIVGVGGQGALLLSNIMADAAKKLDINAVIGEVHGMAQRGGSVFVHLRLGTRTCGPVIPLGRADVIIGLELTEPLRYLDYMSKDGSIIVSTTRIVPPLVWAGGTQYPNESDIVQQYNQFCRNLYVIDSFNIAKSAGSAFASNIVLLGVLAAKVNLPFKKEDILHSLRSLVPANALNANIKAFELGWQEGNRG